VTAAPSTSPVLSQARTAALDDELRARATCQAVIAADGPVGPFAAIVGAEGRHVAALWLGLAAGAGLVGWLSGARRGR
jgi:hypothetical protein